MIRRRASIVCLTLLLTLRAARPAGNGIQDISDDVVKKVDPSVVAIQHERAGGSGFIVSPDGYILTNGHVVRGNDDEDPNEPAKLITVILQDERKYPAAVIGFSMDPDVALIKIEPDEPLVPVEFADSRAAEIGQRCFAVGTPVGLKRTFTSGILSNVDRTDLDTFTTVIQTDAAINPGNSGGPLFDSEGRVLGINTYASRGNNNLGFTVPIHVATVLKAHFLKHGRFVRADVPVFFTGELYDELAISFGVDDGILVHHVMEGTPAETAGIMAGDVVVAIGGKPCRGRTRADLLDHEWWWATREPGSTVDLVLLRREKGLPKKVTVSLTLEAVEPLPKMGRHAGELKEHRYDCLGLGVKRLVRLHRVLHSLSDAEGVLVTRVVRNSPAAKAGLGNNDIVTHVDNIAVRDVASFRTKLEGGLRQQAKAIALTVRRRKSTRRTAIAPYYDMKSKRVLLVRSADGSEHLDLILRELAANGADVNEVPAEQLKRAKTEGHDILLLDGGGEARRLWSNEEVLRLVRKAWKGEKVVAALGPAAVALVIAEPELLEKKLTTSKEDSGEALKRGANYTGNDVEKDGRLITTTAFDRGVVRDFLKALRVLSGNTM